MRKTWLGVLLALLSLAALWPLPQQEEPIRETVSVINVEVPVRVFADGKAVPGLRKEDFQIFEAGKPQLINGFYSLRKRIAAPEAETTQDAAAPRPEAGRYFVLVYRIYEFNAQVQDGLDYLFRELFLPDDQLLVLANENQLGIPRLGEDDQAQNKIRELLANESRTQYNRLLGTLQQIETSLNMTQFKMALRSREDLRPEYLKGFLQSYLEAWKDFKRSYLLPSIDRYYYFARHLENVRKKKWVLNFYQLEQFPQIAFGGQMEQQLRSVISEMQGNDNPTISAQGRMLQKLKSSIDMEMKVADDFPAAEVSKLFYKVNATFHSFFMRISKDTGGKELQFSQVSTDIENSLRELTERTGGSLLASNDLTQSLGRVAQLEDVYYVLTYEPANPKKVGKIKVTVANRKCDVLYDDNIRADYIAAFLQKKEAENPGVKIRGLSFKDRKLALTIVDYSLGKIHDETAGVLKVRIRIKNSEEQTLFDQTKALKAPQKTCSLSLSFNSLAPGKYDIIVDIADQVSGKSCTELIQPLIE